MINLTMNDSEKRLSIHVPPRWRTRIYTPNFGNDKSGRDGRGVRNFIRQSVGNPRQYYSALSHAVGQHLEPNDLVSLLVRLLYKTAVANW
jgi:hypothetical protein